MKYLLCDLVTMLLHSQVIECACDVNNNQVKLQLSPKSDKQH